MFKEAITSEPLEEQLRRRATARLLRSRLQVNAALYGDEHKVGGRSRYASIRPTPSLSPRGDRDVRALRTSRDPPRRLAHDPRRQDDPRRRPRPHHPTLAYANTRDNARY